MMDMNTVSLSTERSWAEIEFGAAELDDPRRTARLVRLAEQRGAQPHASIAECCGTPAASKAAYRFYESPYVDEAEIQLSHASASLERVAAYSIVLAVQDTTRLDYTDHPATRGLGVLEDVKHQGLFLHSTLLVTPERVPLGLLAWQYGQRSAEQLGQRHTRRVRALADKESYKWLQSLDALAMAQAQVPQTQLVSVADREADIYDLFLHAQQLSQALLVRAAWNRAVAHSEKYLWQRLETQAVAGELRVQVPRQAERPARQATLQIRYAPLSILPPRHRRGKAEGLAALAVWAVLAREESAPADSKPIEWLLLSTLPVDSFASACERVRWYTCRWLIEVYHKVLKSGCRVEERQFDELGTIKLYLAIDCVVAWRVLYLTMVGREIPDMPCTAIFEAHEWQALYCFTMRVATPPREPPTLSQAIGWLARLGGHQARKGDGSPGVIVLWRGLQRLHDISMAWQLFSPDPDPPLPILVGKD
jgi:Transposase DNA-binding/Transposase Tn5 dimerisation domain